ncbi:MAG: alkaline phosphatase family protein [Nitrospirota bacterium]
MNINSNKNYPEVLIIGIDGATFDLIIPWAEEGKLPNFARLIKDGMWGDLMSTLPPVTAPAWTSFMTGKNPGRHGLFHFIEPQPNSYEMQYTNARSRGGKSMWQILTDIGKTVGVINVPMTYPPEKVNGYMISGMDTPDENSNFIYPPELYKELKERFGKINLGVQFLGGFRTDKRRDIFLNTVNEIEDQWTQLTLYLMKRYPTDIVMTVFRSPDQVQHLFWHYMDANHPQYDAEGAVRYSQTILRTYKKIDERIGKLIDAVSDKTKVVLMSDHGFGPTSSRVIYINRYLEEIGLLQFKGGNNRSNAINRVFHRGIKNIDDIVRAYLSSNLKAKIANLFPDIRKKWESYSTSFSDIDWSKTKAYACEVLTFPANIWINLKGQKPNGIVEPGREYKEVIDYLMEKLYDLRDPDTGERIIRKVYKKEDIYDGHYLDKSPDLILGWWDAKGFNSRNSSHVNGNNKVVEDHRGKKLVTGTVWSGTHRLNGIVLFKGNDLKRGRLTNKAEIIDVAPTILYLMGLPIPKDMDGQVLLDVIEKDWLSSHPITYKQYDESDKVGSDFQENTYSEEETGKIEERLRGLGYLE